MAITEPSGSLKGKAIPKEPGLGSSRRRKAMRTWKQGTLGRMTLPDSSMLFMKCLKYPLARIYEGYDGESQTLRDALFEAFIELGALKDIERIGFQKLSAEEKSLGEYFSMRYFPGTADIKAIERKTKRQLDELENLDLGGLCTLEDIQAMYLARKKP
jgi:hypothetical protein